jgi:transcriptional regulator with XRE-family HTH domain
MAKESHKYLNKPLQPELLNLSTKLAKECKEKNFSIPKFAEMLGLGEMTLRRILDPASTYSPNLKMLYPIADYFNCNITDLFAETYIIKVLTFTSLKEFQNNIAHSEVNHGLISSLYDKCCTHKFVHIKYLHDLSALFMLTNEIPLIEVSPIACIIKIENDFNFGYLSFSQDLYTFENLTQLSTQHITHSNLNIVAIKDTYCV